MSSMMGNKIRVSLFGQSHGEKIGAVLDGLPAGEIIDEEALCRFLARRTPNEEGTTARRERDIPRIVSGLVDGHTCGAPLCILLNNGDVRRGDYTSLLDTPRPGHADYPAYVKYAGQNDASGGGHFSGRLTAAMCAAGGILLQLYARRGIEIAGHIYSIGGVQDEAFDPLSIPRETIDRLKKSPMPLLDPLKKQEIKAEIALAMRQGDSLGGIVECACIGLPVGLGDGIFGGLDSKIAQTVFAVPAVKGVEFGEGFRASRLMGSENNDPYAMLDGQITLLSNHAGGILGGMSTSAPLIFRAAFKPTPSIAIKQRTVSLKTGQDRVLAIQGRHDTCIVLRAVPCVEAACALALADDIL